MNLIIALIFVGTVLIFLEIFLPGMVAGIVGLIALVVAVILGYQDFGFQTGTLLLGGVLLALMIAGLCWLKFFPESRLARIYISQRTVGDLGVSKPDLLSRTGVAITQLRPSGAAFINGKRVDVVTEGALIDQGASIKVVAVEGARVVVRAL